jgi:hypothetical protein
MKQMDAALAAAGYGVIEFNRPNQDDKTDVVYGFHPVGNTGHDIGPSMTTWQPLQRTFVLKTQHIFSFEYFAYTPIPEWSALAARASSRSVVLERASSPGGNSDSNCAR